MKLSIAEQIRAAGLPEPVTEHQFHPVRKWRFDWAWPAHMVAVEIDGGTWSGGRHVRGKGYEDDCVKINEATLLGWKVIRVTTKMVADGRALDFIERALKHGMGS